MISDEQQDQAALYALDLLSAPELSAFERELGENAELQALVRDLRDAAGSLALTVPPRAPSAAVKQRVLQQISNEARGADAPNVIRPPVSLFQRVLPWALAAALMVFCGLLLRDRAQLQRSLAQARTPAASPMLVALAPAEGGPAKAQAMVMWNPAEQSGMIKISNLPTAAAGKDYQLWAVDAAHKDPISAGIVRVDANGTAQIQFKPTDAAREVKAFAISLEREGGSPTKEGPILLVGTV